MLHTFQSILGVSTLFYFLPYPFIRVQKVPHISRIFQRFLHSSTSFQRVLHYSRVLEDVLENFTLFLKALEFSKTFSIKEGSGHYVIQEDSELFASITTFDCLRRINESSLFKVYIVISIKLKHNLNENSISKWHMDYPCFHSTIGARVIKIMSRRRMHKHPYKLQL